MSSNSEKPMDSSFVEYVKDLQAETHGQLICVILKMRGENSGLKTLSENLQLKYDKIMQENNKFKLTEIEEAHYNSEIEKNSTAQLKRIKALSIHLNMMADMLNEMEDKRISNTKNYNDLLDKSRALSKEAETTRLEGLSVRKDLKEKVKENEGLIAADRNHKAKLFELEATVYQLNEENSQNIVNMKLLREEYVKNQKIIDEMLTKLAEKDLEIRNLVEIKEKLKQNNDVICASKQTLSTEYEALEAQLTENLKEANEKIVEVETKFAKMVNETTLKFTKQHSDWSNQMKVLRQTIKSNEEEISNQKTANTSLQLAQEQLNEDLQKKLQTFEEERNAFTANLEAKRLQVAKLENEIKTLNGNLDEITKEKSDLQSLLTEKSNVIEALKNDMAQNKQPFKRPLLLTQTRGYDNTLKQFPPKAYVPRRTSSSSEASDKTSYDDFKSNINKEGSLSQHLNFTNKKTSSENYEIPPTFHGDNHQNMANISVASTIDFDNIDDSEIRALPATVAAKKVVRLYPQNPRNIKK